MSNGLALLAIIESASSFPLPNLLANYLGGSLAGGSGNTYFRYGGEQAIVALLALTAYDKLTTSTDPDILLDITNGPLPLVQDQLFDEPTDAL